MAADPDIDIIDCGTRPNIRHAMVLAALRNGKHVYNGIPFAADLEQARQLRDAWRASGKVAVVDAFSQWLPAHRAAREMIDTDRSEEHTSELQSLMRISYAVFCLKNKNKYTHN